MAEQLSQIKTDILVIGGGAAATAAAIAAAATGMAVLVVDKKRFGRSGSSYCAGGTSSYWPLDSAETEPEDSAETFIADIVQGGDGIASRTMAENLVRESGQRCSELIRMGMRVRKPVGGGFKLNRILGYSYARPVLQPLGVVPNGGVALMDFLHREALSRGVTVKEHLMVIQLLVDTGRVVGAIGLDTWTGARVFIQTRAIVIAAGSAVDLFSYNSNFAGPRNRYGTTGDSYALLANAGAVLVNMEFLEFTLIPTPNGRAIPVGGTKPTTSAGGRWYNRLGERIMERYDPERMELTTRNIMVLANYLEREAGRGPVSMDLSQAPLAKYQELAERGHPVPQLIAAGLNPRQERIEWSPALHTFLGGALVDLSGQTTVAGLYAAGEAAGHGGAFGADRTGSALTACLVLGHRAGRAAAGWARKQQATSLSREVNAQIREKMAWLNDLGQGTEKPADAKSSLRLVADNYLGIMREGGKLAQAIRAYQAFCQERLQRVAAENPRELSEVVECYNLARTGEMVARAALTREESRGQHHRRDFPRKDDRWQCWIKLQGEQIVTIRPT